MRWLSRSWAAAQAVVTALFLAALGLGGLELLARAWPDDPPAPRATADAFQGQPDAEATLDVVYSGQLQTRFAPFVHFTLAPHDGPLIEIDAEGRRRVPGTATSTRAPTVWMFGGSTMWGMGARDAGTIPAHLARLLGPEVRVVNFGQVGYLSTQEVLALLLELQAGRRPDVAVFYDGVNEVFPALKLGQAGLPLDVARRREEFNITRPDALPRLTGAALTGLVRSSRLLRRFLPAPAPGPAAMPPEAGAAAVLEVYGANVRAARALGEAFGFETLFFWQPTVFTKARRSPDETRWAEAEAGYAPLYAATRARLGAVGPEYVVDLSEVFGDDPRPAFFDFCHVAEAGNAVIAAALLPHVRAALQR
ncbi:MAG: SGNH/GDSL hydrolase family protein [Deltaproteobacteria bacterium]|nr:SGNH/GDSL hydrolase family protein [Deltaproteobacteria bacterium]